MTHTRRLVSAVCLALLLANLPARSNAQQVDTETNNVVYTTVNPAPATAQGAYTWSGFVVTPSTGGGLSGGNVPGYNTSTGTFMFGYAPGTISYGIAVNAALQAAGTGIQVNGFRYSWNYFNQDMNRGTLTGNISLTNSAGAVVESYNYLMPKTTEGWTSMSGIQNFNTQYALPSLGGLGVSFSGKDDRFWAGYYGPQIKDIDVRLLYSTGSQPPTDSNPACTAYSTEPKCLAALTVTSPTTTTTSVTNDSTTPTTTASTTQPTTGDRGDRSGATQEVDRPPPTTTSSSTGNASGPTTGAGSPAPGNTTVASATPPQSAPAKAGEDSAKSAQPQQGGSSGGGASLSMILNIVAGEQTRLGNVERSVVQQAVEQATKEAEKTQKDAERIAGTAQQQSIAASMQSTLNQTLTTPTMNVQPGQGTGLTFFSPIQQSGIGLSGSRSVQQGSIDPIARQDSPVVVGAVQQSVVRPSFSLTTNIDVRRNEEVEMPKSEGIKFGERNQAFNLIEEKPQTVQQTTTTTSTTAVNQKVTENEAAAGVTLASIAMQPRGYDLYFSALPDAQFYAPKEIYKGQKTVDNARALRQLSTDRLHQQMVEQQFNK